MIEYTAATCSHSHSLLQPFCPSLKPLPHHSLHNESAPATRLCASHSRLSAYTKIGLRRNQDDGILQQDWRRCTVYAAKHEQSPPTHWYWMRNELLKLEQRAFGPALSAVVSRNASLRAPTRRSDGPSPARPNNTQLLRVSILYESVALLMLQLLRAGQQIMSRAKKSGDFNHGVSGVRETGKPYPRHIS